MGLLVSVFSFAQSGQPAPDAVEAQVLKKLEKEMPNYAGIAMKIWELVAKAKKELIEERGENFRYESLLGNREPPLDIIGNEAGTATSG